MLQYLLQSIFLVVFCLCWLVDCGLGVIRSTLCFCSGLYKKVSYKPGEESWFRGTLLSYKKCWKEERSISSVPYPWLVLPFCASSVILCGWLTVLFRGLSSRFSAPLNLANWTRFLSVFFLQVCHPMLSGCSNVTSSCIAELYFWCRGVVSTRP